jgi:5S rRNA maturation endonuclease (ribonuclease M5)
VTKVTYNVPDAGVTDRQLKLLRPYLLGERPREDGEWDMFCPLHEDNNRSAQLNVDKAEWYCHAGCGGGSVAALVRKKSEWVPPGRAASNGHARPGRSSKPKEEITPSMVAGWHAALLGNEPVLDDLVTLRGLWTKTLVDFEIGWDESRRCYTIPVYDVAGELVNVRRYQPRPPEGRRKMWGVEGMNGAHLFPVKNLASDVVIIGEGEWDALVTTQYGFPTITRTASAITWKREWNKLFKGKKVYVCHDMDAAGQKANRKVALALAKRAEVYILRLPYPLAEKNGKDLTDYWMDHDGDPDDFRRLLEDAEPFDNERDATEPEEVAPSEVEVLDSFDARRVGRPLRLLTTVKGRRDPGYSIPRKIHGECTQDAGSKCEDCPLFESKDGTAEFIIKGSDPGVLDMIDTTAGQLDPAVKRSIGIPGGKCERLRTTVTEYQSVEVLFARPSVDHMNGSGAGDYKNIKLTSVGRHDTMPNQTVQVVGALYPSPKSQLNEFLAWDIAKMETALDRFELDAETLDALRSFQPARGQRPLKKLREIADDLAKHVTRIYGRPEMHAVMDLAFHSAISFNFAGKRINRGWLDVLVIGDTRTGKSEVATRISRHYRAGEVVSCETATLAGVLGGLQQFGSNKEWAITWGAIPLNDRRLVVLDEAGGLDTERIAEMSSVRSSGVAELNKIQTERTYARTRLIWIANPRNARMQDYTYGVQAIRPLIGNNEDIARFDLAISVAAGEVPSREINRMHEELQPQRYSEEACSALVRWVWSRTPDQIVWDEGAERTVFRQATKLGGRYTEDPPLIQVANVREKIARVAVALAARTFSTDSTCEKIVVTKEHVQDAVKFIDLLYNLRGFGYAERSKELIEDQKEAKRKARQIKVFLYNKPWLAKFLRSAGKFRRQDLEEIGPGVDKEEANAIINTLWEARMVVKDKGDVRLTPTLHNILRETRR